VYATTRILIDAPMILQSVSLIYPMKLQEEPKPVKKYGNNEKDRENGMVKN
jgi:hypothetical protein